MSQYYKIIVKGHFDPPWSDWFESFEINHLDGGLTQLSVLLDDQAALHGLLSWIRDLNLTLISVNHITSNQPQFEKGENHEEN